MKRLSFEGVCFLFVLTACDSSAPARPSSCPDGVLVAASDYDSSALGVLPLDGSPPALTFDTELGADPALAQSAGRAFFLERDDAENVYALDACGTATATYESGGDPQDVAVASDGALWIARFSSGSALVIGASTTGVDLSSADADGNPNASAVRIAQTATGEKAFFALDRLDDRDLELASTQTSAMAVVDVASRTLEHVVTLAGRNPLGSMRQVGATLWLAAAGDVDQDHEIDAGVVTFSTETMSSTLLVPESVIGGSVAAVDVDGPCGAAIAFDAAPNLNHTFLVSFTAAGAIMQPAAFGPTAGFDLAGLLWVDGTLIVGDRRPVPGGYAVHTFTRDAACNLTRGPDLGKLPLPPVAFAPN